MALRRGRIIDVAAELFVEHGFADTTLDSIARHAGVAKRTLYQQFGDKEAIFKVVVAAKTAPHDLMDFPLPGRNKSVRERLTAVGKKLSVLFLADEHIGILRLMVGESRRVPELMNHLVDVGTKIVTGRIARVFQDMIDEALIEPCDTTASATLFVDTVVASKSFLKTLGRIERRPTDAELAERIDLFINGRLRPPADAGAHVAKSASAKKKTTPRKKAARRVRSSGR